MTDITGNAGRIRGFVRDLTPLPQHIDGEDDGALDALSDLKLLVVESRAALRQHVLTCYEEGFSLTEIAEAMQVSRQVVWKMLNKARKSVQDDEQAQLDFDASVEQVGPGR